MFEAKILNKTRVKCFKQKKKSVCVCTLRQIRKSNDLAGAKDSGPPPGVRWIQQPRMGPGLSLLNSSG